MTTIDPALLPARIMLDTSTFNRALAPATHEPGANVCRALVDAIVAKNGRVLLAAMSAAELLRRHTDLMPELMNGKDVELLPFDQHAALCAAQSLPPTVVKEIRDKADPTLPLQYYKTDALIIAVGLADKIDCFVSVDNDMQAMAKRAGLTVAAPSDFVAVRPRPQQHALFPDSRPPPISDYD